MMDDDSVSQAEFSACMADLARVNTLTRARPPTLAWLARATRGIERDGGFTLLDVGFGEGDMLRAIQRWAARRGLRPRLAGVDLNPRSAPAAQAVTDEDLGIEYRTGDVFSAAYDRPVDFVVSSLVAHHMADAEIVRFLRWMEAHAGRGWFVNDLHRHPAAFYGFKALAWAARWHPFVQHDGPVSSGRAFSRADWRRLLFRAGLGSEAAHVRWWLPFRLCVTRFRPHRA